MQWTLEYRAASYPPLPAWCARGCDGGFDELSCAAATLAVCTFDWGFDKVKGRYA